jgi:hypothetical protein
MSNSILLGYDNTGKAVTSADIKGRPLWFQEMSSLTTEGQEVAAAVYQAMADMQERGPMSEAEYQVFISADKKMMGLPH